MTGYQIPDGTYVSASWQSHKDRTPPSSEPGTDYGCAYGTSLYAADPGTVYATYGNTGPGGRIVEVRLDDGRTVRYLHLSSIKVSKGQRLARGQLVGISGASGNGSDYYYGPHVHTTLLTSYTAPLYNAVDFERYTGTAPGPTPTPPNPAPIEEDDDMPDNSGFYYTRASDKATVRIVTNAGSGYWVEWADNTIDVNKVAAAYNVPAPFALVTEGMRNAQFSAAKATREGGGQAGTYTAEEDPGAPA